MKGYAKIKENNPFSQRSKSKKENPFLHQDLDVNLHTKKSQENDQKPNIFEDDHHNKIYTDLFQTKTDDHDHKETKSKVLGSVLRRNLTISASSTSSSSGYQKNGKNSNLERQSSARVIQEAVKRAFSMRRCSSVNNSNSDRYCRIYDQPKNVEDCDYVYDDYGNDCDYGFEKMNNNNKDDYDYSNNNNNNNNSGKKHVGSKVVKACKRLFSR